MVRIYRYMKGYFLAHENNRKLEKTLKSAADVQKFQKLPDSLHQLDESYCVLMRELAKR